MQCKQAHKLARIKCNQTSLWACSPYLCAFLLSKNFDPSRFILLYSSMLLPLCPCPCPIIPKAFISLYNLSPFVINFHKRCASCWCKGLHWGRWLRLESCIFYGHDQICWNNTTCISLEIPHIGSLTLIPIGGEPPPMSYHRSSTWYTWALVCEGTCFTWWSFKVEDHLWIHHLMC